MTTMWMIMIISLLHAILLLLASTQCSSAATSQKGDNLIRQTCKRAANNNNNNNNNFNLCVATLQSDPRSFNASDVKGLARISLELVLAKANETLQTVGKLFKDTRERLLFEFLGTCIEEYNKAVTRYLPEAISALNSNKFGASKQGAEDAANDAKICEDQSPGQLPVSKQNKQVQDLSLVASSIISTLG